MKTKLFCFLALCCLPLVCNAQAGRYQLFTALVEEDDKPNPPKQTPTLFRIDTENGQVWRLSRWLITGPKKRDGLYAEGWTVLSEDFDTSLYLSSQIVGLDVSSNPLHGKTNTLRLRIETMYLPPETRAAILSSPVPTAPESTNASPKKVEEPVEKKDSKKSDK
jgi:hypothetical protein